MGSVSRMLHVHDMGTIEVRHDFCSWVTGGDGLNVTLTDTGTFDEGNAFGGVRVLTPGASGSVDDNDQAYIHTDKCFLFQADKPLYGAAYFKTTAVTDATPSFQFGFSSADVLDSLPDAGSGAPATYSGALFIKQETGTVWDCETSKAGAQVTSAGEATFTDATYELFEIKFFPNDAIKGTVEFWHKGVLIYSDAALSTASHAVMRGILGVKLHAATNNDTISVDWVVFKQLR